MVSGVGELFFNKKITKTKGSIALFLFKPCVVAWLYLIGSAQVKCYSTVFFFHSVIIGCAMSSSVPQLMVLTASVMVHYNSLHTSSGWQTALRCLLFVYSAECADRSLLLRVISSQQHATWHKALSMPALSAGNRFGSFPALQSEWNFRPS